MASCECCWTKSYSLAMARPTMTQTDAYYAVMKEHQERGCVCTKPNNEGNKSRAGQFWKDGRDTRLDRKGEGEGR